MHGQKYEKKVTRLRRYFFGAPTSPEKLVDYQEHHAQTYHFPDVRRRPQNSFWVFLVATPPRPTLTLCLHRRRPTRAATQKSGTRSKILSSSTPPPAAAPKSPMRHSCSIVIFGSLVFFAQVAAVVANFHWSPVLPNPGHSCRVGRVRRPKKTKPAHRAPTHCLNFLPHALLTLLPPTCSKKRRIRFDVRLMQRVPYEGCVHRTCAHNPQFTHSMLTA